MSISIHTPIKETSEDTLTTDINYFLTECRNGEESQDGTYYVSDKTYRNTLEYVERIHRNNPGLFEIDYHEDDDDLMFVLIYPFAVGDQSYLEFRFRVYNLARVFAAYMEQQAMAASRDYFTRINEPVK